MWIVEVDAASATEAVEKAAEQFKQWVLKLDVSNLFQKPRARPV
jgi:hypothetical protein